MLLSGGPWVTLGPGQGAGSGLLCPCPHGCDGASAPVSARGGAGTQAGRAETGEGALAAAMHSWRDMGCVVPGAHRVRGPAGPAAPTHIQERCSSRSLHQQQKSERGQGDGKTGEAA